MKAVKIILGIAAMTVIAFTSCKNANDTLGESAKEMFEYSQKKNTTTNAEVTAAIDYTNSTGEFVRGMRLFDNKKKGIVVNLVIKDASAKVNPGVVGIAFDLTKNKAGTYNFILLGMRNLNGHPYMYVEQYRNIKESDFSKDNLGATEVGYVKEPTDKSYKNPITGVTNEKKPSDQVDLTDYVFPCAKEILGLTTYEDVNINKDTKQLSVGVCVKALSKNDIPESDADYVDGNSESDAYIVTFYDTTNITDLTVLGKTKNPSTDNIIDTVEISRNMIQADDKVQEGKMGFYANVYANSTLKGEWQVSDIKHNPNEPFWADEGSRSANANPLEIELQ